MLDRLFCRRSPPPPMSRARRHSKQKKGHLTFASCPRCQLVTLGAGQADQCLTTRQRRGYSGSTKSIGSLRLAERSGPPWRWCGLRHGGSPRVRPAHAPTSSSDGPENCPEGSGSGGVTNHTMRSPSSPLRASVCSAAASSSPANRTLCDTAAATVANTEGRNKHACKPVLTEHPRAGARLELPPVGLDPPCPCCCWSGES